MGRRVNDGDSPGLQHGAYTAVATQHPAPANLAPPNFDVSDLIVAYLEKLGVQYVFGVPGGAIEPLYNAMSRSERRGGLKTVVARHEVGAAFMAHGYYQNSGKLGVCCATTGPGTTNLVTGVASAYENNIPLLVISAQTALGNFGRKALQESSDTGINTVGMFQFCTGYNTLVSHVDQFEHKLVTAIMTAMSNSCPVNLSIPLDILRTAVPVQQPGFDVATLVRTPHLQDDVAVDALCQQLHGAEKIVFVLGGACHEAIAIILRAAFKLKASIVTTPDGKGLISPYHPLFRGVIGFAGHESAELALLDSDVDTVVAVGTTLGEWASNGWDANAVLNNRLIHIEPQENNLTRSPMARLHVRGRLLSIFERLLTQLDTSATDDEGELVRRDLAALRWQAKKAIPWQDKGPEPGLERDSSLWKDELVKPQWLMGYLTKFFPPSTKYVVDSGNSVAWAVHYLHPFDRRVLERRQVGRTDSDEQRNDAGRRGSSAGLFQAAMEFSSMGWAIGASVGAAFASPRQAVVCITGDGSMLMSGQEITVALQHQLQVVFIIMNDSSLGMVKHGQRLAGAEEVGHELPVVDFAAMAQAMGVRGHVIRSPRDFMNLSIDDVVHEGPTLLDLRIDPEEVPPMGVRMKVLQSGVD